MKKLHLLSFIYFGTIFQSIACDVCKRNQPELLQDISHGTGPQADSDYFIIGGAILIVLITLIYSVKYLLKPGERNPEHIKNLILK
ncbi:hypothetical protein SAMN04488104_103635 [Algoriphagus faecimaris]|uniref:Uncharacterized protein n=1 Tax=Algoriphagus faecimaris TaxID=686796 RepID=A0A1G6VM48_9BACT|nr:hypothetical protein [Algoriphagus faecimaris]SDD54614.1 hypothetical protein SAMN04488104_103635 [Algoriphagus faecimaris]